MTETALLVLNYTCKLQGGNTQLLDARGCPTRTAVTRKHDQVIDRTFPTFLAVCQLPMGYCFTIVYPVDLNASPNRPLIVIEWSRGSKTHMHQGRIDGCESSMECVDPITIGYLCIRGNHDFASVAFLGGSESIEYRDSDGIINVGKESESPTTPLPFPEQAPRHCPLNRLSNCPILRVFRADGTGRSVRIRHDRNRFLVYLRTYYAGFCFRGLFSL